MSFNLILKLHTVKCEIYPQVLAKRIVCFQAKLRLVDTYGQQLAQSRQTIPCAIIRTMSYLKFLSLFAGKDIDMLIQLSIQVNCFL